MFLSTPPLVSGNLRSHSPANRLHLCRCTSRPLCDKLMDLGRPLIWCGRYYNEGSWLKGWFLGVITF
jgi:hypothetical protein